MVYEIRRQNVFMYLLSETLSVIKRTFCDRTLSPYWNNDLPPTIKDCIQTTHGKKSSSESEGGSNYELVVFLGSANSLI